MKHLKKVLIAAIGVLLMASGAFPFGANASKKDVPDAYVQNLAIAMKAMNYIYGLTKHSHPYDAEHRFTPEKLARFHAKIGRYFHTIQDPYALQMIAIQCFHLGYSNESVNPENDALETEFDACFDFAVGEISWRKGEAAKEALHALHYRLPLDGAAGETVDEAEWALKHRAEEDETGKGQKRE